MKTFSEFIEDFNKQNLEYILRKEFFRLIKLAKKRPNTILTSGDDPFWITNHSIGKIINLTSEYWIQPVAFKTTNKNFRTQISTGLFTNIKMELIDVFKLSDKQYTLTTYSFFTKRGEPIKRNAFFPTTEPQINSRLNHLVKFLAKVLEEKQFKFDIF